MQEPSVFTKIVTGEIPSHTVYEDDQTLAFLDIFSTVEGHVLVIPKKQVEFVWDLDDETYQALMATVKTVAQRLRTVLSVPHVGVKVIGVDVPHAHVHLIPFTDTNTYQSAGHAQVEPDHEALAATAQRLAF